MRKLRVASTSLTQTGILRIVHGREEDQMTDIKDTPTSIAGENMTTIDSTGEGHGRSDSFTKTCMMKVPSRQPVHEGETATHLTASMDDVK
jgi:hypothetical protein